MCDIFGNQGSLKITTSSNSQSYPEALNVSPFESKACSLGALGGKEKRKQEKKMSYYLDTCELAI